MNRANDQLATGTVIFGSTATGKLNRTEKGRELLEAESSIVDTVNYDDKDPDRIWIGVRRASFSKPKHATTRCTMDERVMSMMTQAILDEDSGTLNALAVRLLDALVAGRRDCRFMLEDDS